MLELYGRSGHHVEQGLARRLLGMAHTTGAAPQIDITVKRQIVLSVDGHSMARSYTIGTGSMRSVPPGYVPQGADPDRLLTVDYEGEIKFAPNVSVGGFDIGRIRVSVSVS